MSNEHGSDGVHVDAERVATGKAVEVACNELAALLDQISDLHAEQCDVADKAIADLASRFVHPEPRVDRARHLLDRASRELSRASEYVDAALGEVNLVLQDDAR